jgi:abortive infection bacteriophage resistance protein
VTTRYNKPALTIDEQLALLESRGMSVQDRSQARRTLGNVSYYRLSGYWYPFREIDGYGQRLDSFRRGTTFEKVIDLYEFDRQLRIELLDAIERIEIAMRTGLTYAFAHHAGAFGHTDAKWFRRGFDHASWIARIEDETDRSREKFVEHYRVKYDGFPRLPLWMATEVMSFGSLSHLFKNVVPPVRTDVATRIGVHHARELDARHHGGAQPLRPSRPHLEPRIWRPSEAPRAERKLEDSIE